MLFRISSAFKKDLSKDQIKDTGLAVVLIMLLISLFYPDSPIVKISIFILIITMTVPKLIYPIAVLWIGFSNLLGFIIPKIILSLVFFIIVTPIGLIRKFMGYDSLQLKDFKKESKSVLVIREQKFSKKDIEKPF